MAPNQCLIPDSVHYYQEKIDRLKQQLEKITFENNQLKENFSRLERVDTFFHQNRIQREKKVSELEESINHLRKELHNKQKETDDLKLTVKEKLLKQEHTIKDLGLENLDLKGRLESKTRIIEKLEEENKGLLSRNKVKNISVIENFSLKKSNSFTISNREKTQEKEQQQQDKETNGKLVVRVISAGFSCGNFASIDFDQKPIIQKDKSCWGVNCAYFTNGEWEITFFHPYAKKIAVRKFVNFLKTRPTLLLIAVKGEAAWNKTIMVKEGVGEALLHLNLSKNGVDQILKHFECGGSLAIVCGAMLKQSETTICYEKKSISSITMSIENPTK